MIKKEIVIVLSLILTISFIAGCTTTNPTNYPPPDTSHSNNKPHGGGSNNNHHSNQNNEPEPPEQENETAINTVSISSQTKNVSLHQIFTIDISCEPIEPIKSWEITLSFDPHFLEATEIMQGGFFDGFDTFPSPNPIIDNVNGSITRFYSLIIGQGNTSNAGILSTIRFMANRQGTTNLNITMIGLTNETMYLPVKTVNGTINIY